MDLYSTLWPVHAIFMGAGFLAMLAGTIIRLAGKKTKWWFQTHHFLGYIGAIGSAGGIVIAVMMISLTHGFHFSNTHSIIGIIAVAVSLTAFGVIVGLKKIRKELKGRVRTVHRVFGWITLPLMLFIIILGLRLTGIV